MITPALSVGHDNPTNAMEYNECSKAWRAG